MSVFPGRLPLDNSNPSAAMLRSRDQIDEYYSKSLGATVPETFAQAVYVATRATGMTLADYVRTALSERLVRDGIVHRTPPRLGKTTYLHPHRQAG